MRFALGAQLTTFEKISSTNSGGTSKRLICGLDKDPTGESLTSVKVHMQEGLQSLRPPTRCGVNT
jgi:hypothetical protein